MNTLLLEYPYLFSQLIWLLLFLILLLFLSNQRHHIILAGLLALPQAFFAIGLIPEYWHPKRIFVLGVGLEDFIFSFLAGGLSWGCSIIILQRKLRLDIRVRLFLKRYLICCLFGISSIILLTRLGMRGIKGPLITLFLWGVILFLLYRRFWPIALWGFIGFLILYFLGFEIILLIWPDLPSFWTWENLLGYKFLGIPIEELIWASLYGPIWALTVGFLLNARIQNYTLETS